MSEHGPLPLFVAKPFARRRRTGVLLSLQIDNSPYDSHDRVMTQVPTVCYTRHKSSPIPRGLAGDGQKGEKPATDGQSLQPTEISTPIGNSPDEHKGEAKMNAYRKIAIIVGALYLTVNIVAGPLGLALTEPTLGAPDYLLQLAANETQMLIGVLLVLVMAVADAGIGIAMYPVLKKRNTSVAIGYFGARIAESVIFIISAITLLLLVTLGHEFVQAGAPDASYFQTLGELLLAVRDWSGHVVLDVAVFPLGALALYYVLYQSKLVPRWLSGWGLIAALSYWASSLLVMFSLLTPLSTVHIVLQAPLGLQEVALALWLIVKGFNPAAIASEPAGQN